MDTSGLCEPEMDVLYNKRWILFFLTNEESELKERGEDIWRREFLQMRGALPSPFLGERGAHMAPHDVRGFQENSQKFRDNFTNRVIGMLLLRARDNRLALLKV